MAAITIAPKNHIYVEIAAVDLNQPPLAIKLMFTPAEDTLYYTERNPDLAILCSPQYIGPCPGGTSCVCTNTYLIHFPTTTLRWAGGVYALCLIGGKRNEDPPRPKTPYSGAVGARAS